MVYNRKVLATGPAHGIQLKGGRLLVPVWLSLGTGGHAHRPSVTSTIYSDDHGQTWHRGEIAVPDSAEWIFPNETALCELSDGRVMLNVRSESKAHHRLVTRSKDGATDWTTPKIQDELLEPICMGSLVVYSRAGVGGQNLLLFANPHNLAREDGKEEPGKSRDRKNLTIKLSADDGQSWPLSRALEPGYSAYSDLAVLPDGTILCFYERGAAGTPRDRYGALCLARLNLEWIKAGKGSSK